MNSLFLALKKTPIVYVTRDIERALGVPPSAKNYHIIANKTSFAKSTKRTRNNCLLIGSKTLLNTHELLEHPRAVRYLQKLNNPRIVVFKNTPLIEKICAERGWKLLNPASALGAQVEEKISQLAWLGPLTKYLPPHQVVLGKDLAWKGTPFIAQFNRAHTGSGTLFIENADTLNELKKKFPNREIRVTRFVDGIPLTNNNIVWGETVLPGNISYQITGLKPFTDQPFATIGNDWALPRTLLTKKQLAAYRVMAEAVGKRLAASGWRGLFGLDVILEKKSGQLFLIEINARQPASATFESFLQTRTPKTSKKSVNTFCAHLSALLSLPYAKEKIIEIASGAQLVQRVTASVSSVPKNVQKKLHSLGLTVTDYPNTKPGADLVRLQTAAALMAECDVFNYLGTAASRLLDRRPENYRVGVVLIRDKKLLLMKRFKKGEHYYSIIAGKAQQGETLAETALREGREETNVRFSLDMGRAPLTRNGKTPEKRELYFFTRNVKGNARLGGPESKRSNPNNTYELAWVTKQQLTRLPLRQANLKPALLKALNR